MSKSVVRRCAVSELLETRRLFATFTVANLNPDGPGSLADAVAQSNDSAGADVIEFGASAVGSIQLASILEITGSLEVNGPGASALSIVGGGEEGNHRIFSITADDTSTKVTIAGLTLTGGDYDFGGAAVNNYSADVTIDSCVLINNFAAAGDGGAVATSGGALTITNSTLANNATGGQGGGGAISAADATVRISNSTISGNTSVGSFGGGGGIALSNDDTIIENCTISGNTESDGSGGGIQSSGGTLVIRNSTIANNSASQTIEPERGRGGGIYIFDGDVTLISTIVADNTAGSTFGGQDLAISETAAPVNANHSLIENVDAASLSATSTANIVIQDPKLTPLANNGGTMQTQALGAASPAIDAGSNDANLTSDQRGDGFARVVGAAADIGAFESDGTAPVTSTVTAAIEQTQPPVVAGASGYAFFVTFSNGAVDVSSVDANDLTVTGPGNTPQQVQFLGVVSQSATSTTARYQLAAPGGTIDDTDNGAYNVSINSGAVKDSSGAFVSSGPIGTFALVSGGGGGVGSGADIAVIAASVKLPATVINGTKVKGSAVVTVTNPGDAAENSPVALYLSADGTLDANDTRVATTAKPAALKIGATKRAKLKIVSLPSIAAGTYQVLAVIDPDNALAEANKSNNVFATGVSINVEAARSDLAVQLTSVPASIGYAGKHPAAATITNTGNVPFLNAATIYIQNSSDITLGGEGEHVLGTVTKTIKLKPGATKTFKFNLLAPEITPANSYYLIAGVTLNDGSHDDDASNDASPSATPIPWG